MIANSRLGLSWLPALLIAGGLTFGLNSCNSSSEESGDNVNTTDSLKEDSTETSPAPIATPTPLAPITGKTQPQQCEILFDASVSMQGYVNATEPGDFPGVVAEVNNLPSGTTQAFLFDAKRNAIGDFLSKLQNKKISWTNESDIFAMTRDILTSASDNPANVYALVTDGIMSGSNAQVGADRTYNITNREILKGRIDSIVSKLPAGKDLSVMVAKYLAPFNGTYYCYDNSKKTLKNDHRPFYLIMAGGTEQINYVMDNLQKRTGMETVQYGSLYPVNITTNAKFTGKKGVYKCDKATANEGLNVDINIKDLPAFAADINYLIRNLEIIKAGENRKATTRPLEYEKDYTLSIEGKKLRVTFDQKVINLLPATFTFNIKRAQPQWIADSSADNDKDAYTAETTLNLSYFLAPFLRLNGAATLNETGKASLTINK